MANFAAAEQVNVKNKMMYSLKMQGPQTAADLAEQLSVSPMAIRQHLQALLADKLVTYEESKQPVGRPLKFWKLTEKAMDFFPNHHADLVVKLIEGVAQVFGVAGLDSLITQRTEAQIQAYSAQMTQNYTLRERVNTLAQLRTQEGYMAEVIEESPDVLLLVENHCSICIAAQNAPQLCTSELEVFTKLLGKNANIERVEHLLKGERRCTYRVQFVEGR